ncbi:MAG: DUF6427 family protein [Aureibaculum sp.]|nr:DUF6427 family protein [Aureibaculum sp.]
MIANFFNTTKPFNTLVVIAVLALIYGVSSFYSIDVNIDFIILLKKGLFFLILLLTFFIVNFIIRKNGLSKDNSYVLFLMVLFFGMFPLSTTNYLLIITNIILLFAYRRIYSLRTNKDIKEKIFDSAFWVGIATIVYPWCFLFLFLVYAAISTFKKATLRNVFIPLIGFLTPILILGAFLFISDDFDNYNWQLNYNFSFLDYNSLRMLVPITIIIGFLLWTIPPTTIKISSVNNEFKTSWLLVLFHLLVSVIIVLTSIDKNGSEFIFMFFPTAIIFTNYLQIEKEKWFKDVFLYLFLAVTISIYLL